MLIEEITLQVEGIEAAQLHTYVRENSPEIDLAKRRPAVIICPGGGYSFLSDREAEPIALEMVSRGYQAFVLTYSVAPAVFPTALIQLAAAVVHVRKNSEKYATDPEKIIVAGFSAGGHLAASLGVFWQQSLLQKYLPGANSQWQPNALLLSYPVISSKPYGHQDSFKNLLGAAYTAEKAKLSLEEQVTDKMPPTFIWHTMADDLVTVENSLSFVKALLAKNVPTEFHAFMRGGHGLSLGTAETQIGNGYGLEKNIQLWPELFDNWLTCLFEKE
ncbi:alpha/beta hydrolase [Candidatus Enterococcus leclercqii]|uniref:alpha/beta hydrolase n=1 Tax=Candidatus Enterococcus leclercqii TaxID=1857218 RepID=UPI00137B721D|nr:alpha/beta hydrolase [Enterococcus sp. CU9D]KAF1290777.1 acetylesterase [Enterococcus sp. CU9D]